MKMIDTHVHLGDIFGDDPEFRIERRASQTFHSNKKNLYEVMSYTNVYFGCLNYLFKPIIAAAARDITRYANRPNLIDSMDKNNIDRSVVLALEPHVSTDSILTACKGSDRLIPFGSIHPHDKDKKQKLKRYVKAGIRGLKLHPVIQKVAPDDPATFELIEEAQPYNIPVLFHVGWGSIGKGSYGFVNRYKQLAANFPRAPLIFAHMGFYQSYPLLELVRNSPNIYCDTSWQPATIVEQAIKLLGEDRILFGSDWPYNLQATPLKIALSVTAGNDNLRDKILFKNAERLLRL